MGNYLLLNTIVNNSQTVKALTQIVHNTKFVAFNKRVLEI